MLTRDRLPFILIVILFAGWALFAMRLGGCIECRPTVTTKACRTVCHVVNAEYATVHKDECLCMWTMQTDGTKNGEENNTP